MSAGNIRLNNSYIFQYMVSGEKIPEVYGWVETNDKQILAWTAGWYRTQDPQRAFEIAKSNLSDRFPFTKLE